MMTIREAFNYTKQQLEKAGVADPAFDTMYLFEYVFSITRTDIAVRGDTPADEKKLELLKACIDRRVSGEPVQYIIGEWEFMGRTFKIGDGVLIPRDDTEVLVRACMELDLADNASIVDLCSGSGIIAVTLRKHFADSAVYAVEKSDVAYSYLCKNCELNNADVKTVHSDLYECVDGFADRSIALIVSNPPYIKDDEVPTLQKEVQFEPKMALCGGTDGFDFYRGIVEHYAKKLKVGGYIAFEIGEGQFEYIKELLKNSGFTDIRGYLDLGNTVRALTAVYTP